MKGWFDGWDLQGGTENFNMVGIVPESALGYCKKVSGDGSSASGRRAS